MKSNIKIIKKWKKWINEITNDIIDLVENRYVFNEVVSICKKEQKLKEDNLFWDFFKRSYIASMVTGVCRQVDADKDSLSIHNLLNEIFENPQSIIKRWFVVQYQKNYQNTMRGKMGRMGRNDFEQNFGKGEFVDPVLVFADMGKLLYNTREIKKFRNKRIAHKDKNKKLKFNINFNDLNKAVDILEQITIKYNLLLNQSGYLNNTLLPIIQYDWQEIFKFPWIKCPARQKN